MKILLILVISAICLYIGYYFYKRYDKRRKFFLALVTFAEKLMVDINFSRERLKVIISNFDAQSKKNLLGIDEKFVEYLDKKIALDSGEIFKSATCLKDSEKDTVFLFLKTLGRSDVENQTKEIKSFVERFNENKAVCEQEYKKYGSLSIKLSIVLALLLAVIII